MTRPGWYPDPSSRYPKRWYDGNDWTASVLDHNGQQSYDQLPAAGAPAVASLPPATPSAPPPRPPGASSPPPPPGAAASAPPSPWAPAASSAGSWQSTPSQGARPYTPPTPGGVWGQQQQPVTTASLGLTPPAVVRSTSSGRTSPVVVGLVGVAVACLVLSMFVLDWYSEAGQSVGFHDFGDGSILGSAPLLDKLTFWNFKWLGFVIAALAIVTVFVIVIGRSGSHHAGHVLAAMVATIGAVVSTLAIVRLFRTDEFNPDVGAWLLPAGYLVLLLAIVVSARNEPA